MFWNFSEHADKNVLVLMSNFLCYILELFGWQEEKCSSFSIILDVKDFLCYILELFGLQEEKYSSFSIILA